MAAVPSRPAARWIPVAFLLASAIALGQPGPAKPSQGAISADLLSYRLHGKTLDQLQQAQRAADRGDHSAAIRRLEKTLAKYPESAAWAESMLGVEYLRSDQPTAALSSLEHAVKLLPRDAVNRANLALCLILTDQYERAEQELRQAIRIDHNNEKAQQLLQSLLIARQQQVARSPN